MTSRSRKESYGRGFGRVHQPPGATLRSLKPPPSEAAMRLGKRGRSYLAECRSGQLTRWSESR
jgi:hypothetical protein